MNTYDNSTVFNTVWHWFITDLNMIENPQIDSHMYSQLIYLDKGRNIIRWRKNNLFNKSGLDN